ncbi:endonuclease/exonuclease/phosphatase family protein [Mesoflavibacter profundi]|uniref:endonuclease/exonuclease/phosphatase family protein n=1 Tax=Mesoflavibacter profundi TaxID=2708110 RepID=UPI00168B9E20|nr:endonuclease/exonuclease/phosphatase family protein [Mesoflavibacter profundi]
MKIFKGLYFLFFFCAISLVLSCKPNSKGNKSRKVIPELVVDSKVKDFNREIKSNSNTSFDSLNQIKIISWNIKDLGRTKSDDELNQISKIINVADVVLIQEVVGKDPAGAQAVAKIADNLNRMGFKWDYSISMPTQSPSSHMSERYAFLWKTNVLKLKSKPFLASKYKDVIYREPYVANFQIKKNNKTFSAINYHSRKHYDKPEIEIVYLKNIIEDLDNNSIIIGGDFNLNEEHEIWDLFYSNGYSNALKNTKTTIKQKCSFGKYLSHSIDNFYYTNISVSKSNSIDIVKDCDNINQSRQLSDHLPIFMFFSVN